MLLENKNRLILFSTIISFFVLLIYLFSSLQIKSDMSFFVANNKTITDKIIQNYLIDGEANQLLFILLSEKSVNKISAEEPNKTVYDYKQLANLSNKVKSTLKHSGRFLMVENGHNLLQNMLQSALQKKEKNKLYNYRYLLTDSLIKKDKQELDLFSVSSLKEKFSQLNQRLKMVLSPLEYQYISQSPLNRWFDYIALFTTNKLNKNSSKQLSIANNIWLYEQADKPPQAILLLKTKAPGFALDQQKQNINFIHRQLKNEIPEGYSYALSGAALIALSSSQKISFQIKVISSIASIILMSFLFLLFRSVKILLLVSLPLLLAIVAGTSMVNLIYGYIHGISLAFGITIIGVAVDYPLHYFSHIIANNANSSVSLVDKNNHIILKIWPKIQLGLVTTIIGFSAITFSSFSGLNQLGIFAITGLITAAMVTRFLLPVFQYKSQDLKKIRSLKQWQDFFRFKSANFSHFNRYFHFFRYLALSLILLSLVNIFTSQKLWENDLSSLSPVNSELKSNDFKLRKLLNLPELRYLLTVSAKSEQELLEKTENIIPFLDSLVSSGAISFYESTSRYFPSIKKQLLRQQQLPDKKLLTDNLTQALQGSQFEIQAFEPFIEAVAKSKTLKPLSSLDLDNSLLATKIKAMISFNKLEDNTWTGLIFLSGVDNIKLVNLLEQGDLKQVDLKLIDIKKEMNQLVEKYRIESLRWFFLGSFFIILFILFHIKKIQAIPALIFPFSGAIILTISLLLFLGYSLTIFHLVTLLLVVGLGIDYSIFLYDDDPKVYFLNLFSVSVCVISSLIMFVALSLSSIPVLKAIGLTASLGAGFSFLLTLIFSRNNSRNNTHYL